MSNLGSLTPATKKEHTMSVLKSLWNVATCKDDQEEPIMYDGDDKDDPCYQCKGMYDPDMNRYVGCEGCSHKDD